MRQGFKLSETQRLQNELDNNWKRSQPQQHFGSHVIPFDGHRCPKEKKTNGQGIRAKTGSSESIDSRASSCVIAKGRSSSCHLIV